MIRKMNLRNKRIIVSKILKVGLDRVWLDPNRMTDIKDAITRDDLRKLIANGAILVKQKRGVSRSRVRITIIQRKKGRRSGPGSKRGKQTARLGRKESWINKIRAQRELFSTLLRNKIITKGTYRYLRAKAKGGFFRSRRHIKLFLTEHNLWVNKK